MTEDEPCPNCLGRNHRPRVDERVRGDCIETTWFSEKPEPFKSSPQLMASELPGRRIDRVHRVGKHIVFDLAGGPAPGLQWIVHLGMTGRLLVADAQTPVPRHTHAILRLVSGRELRFVDPRRFGRMELHGIPTRKTARFTGTGQEPFAISRDQFAALFRPRRTSIKAALLNQKLLHGVGNIYADESLFRAGIRPRRMAGRSGPSLTACTPPCRPSSGRQLRWAGVCF